MYRTETSAGILNDRGQLWLLARHISGEQKTMFQMELDRAEVRALLDSAARALGCDVYDPAEDADSEL